MRKSKNREVKYQAQGHSANRQRSENWSQDRLALEPELLRAGAGSFHSVHIHPNRLGPENVL